MMWTILIVATGFVVVILLMVGLYAVTYMDRQRIRDSMVRVEKLLDLAEKHGKITERQQGSVGRVIGEAAVKAEQVAKVAEQATKEKAEDIKEFVLEKIRDLTNDIDVRFKHVDEEFGELKELISKLVDPHGVGR